MPTNSKLSLMRVVNMKVELNAHQVVLNLLRRFGTLSFRHLLAITELPVIELRQSLHELVLRGKIQRNTEMAPKEGLIDFYEIIDEESAKHAWKDVNQQEMVSDMAIDDPEKIALETSA